jgi:long-chain acyl-CoA synthetase
MVPQGSRERLETLCSDGGDIIARMGGYFIAGFERLLADRADHPAVFALSERRVLSFADLAYESEAIKSRFESARVPNGSCVLALAGNRSSWFSLFLACLARGDVLMSLDAQTSSTEAWQLASRYGVSAMVAPASREDLYGTGVRAVQELPGDLRLLSLDRAPTGAFEEASLLKLTSGSVGTPRAVLVSQDDLWNDGRHIVEAMAIREEDVSYGVISLSHSYGLGNLVAPLFMQGTPVALRDLFLPGQLFEDARATNVSVFPGVPFLFEQILAQLRERGLPPSLRLLVTAGARIKENLVARFKEELGVKIHSFYGSSETGGITYDDDDEVGDPLSVGRVMPETEVTLRGNDSAFSTEKRIHVRGNAVARGYVEASDGDEMSEFLDDGFLTGDLGRLDERGRLYLTGRVSSFVNVAGRKVDPDEAEIVLLAMPEIADAKVLGLPCDRRGQKLVAFVVPLSGELSPARVRTYCAEKLSPHKIPRDLILLDSLPLTARGKIDRRALEQLTRSGSDVQEPSDI